MKIQFLSAIFRNLGISGPLTFPPPLIFRFRNILLNVRSLKSRVLDIRIATSRSAVAPSEVVVWCAKNPHYVDSIVANT